MNKVFCILVVLLSVFCWGWPIARAGEAGSGQKAVVERGLYGERAELISKPVQGRRSAGATGMSEPLEQVSAVSGKNHEADEAQEVGKGDAGDELDKGGHDESVSKTVRLNRLLKLRKIEKSFKAELQKERGTFRKNVTELLRDPVLRSGVNSIYVVDVFSGSPIYSYKAKKLLNPASNVKLIATAAVLDALGPSWRYETFLEGKLLGVKGDATGDLYLRGFFDPILSAAELGSLVDDLSGTGVEEIRGDLFLDRGALLPKGDSLELEIVVLGKTSKIYSIVNSDTDNGEELFTPMAQLLVSKEVPFLELESRVRIDTHAQNDVSADFVLNSKKSERGLIQGSGSLLGKVVVSGRIRPGDMLKVSLTIHDPYIRTAKVLCESLERSGIELKGKMRIADPKRHKRELGTDKVKDEEGPSPLVVHRSQSIADFVTTTNKYSNNYLADSLTATLGAHVFGGAPTLKKGTEAMKRWLVWRTGIGTKNILLDTGSGLSYKTRLSARHIIRVLRVAGGFRSPTSCPPKVAGGVGKSFWACKISVPSFVGKNLSHSEKKQADSVDPHRAVSEVFRSSLAVGKKDGTLRRRMRYLHLNSELIGKTGTLNGISALSGFLSKGEDNKVAFSIVTNGADRFQPSTLRRRHGWFIGHLDAFLVSRRRLFDQLRETRKKIAEIRAAAHEAYVGRELRRVAESKQGLSKEFGKHGEPWDDAPVGHGEAFEKAPDSIFRSKSSEMKSRLFAGLGVGVMAAGEVVQRNAQLKNFQEEQHEESFVFPLNCFEAQRSAISAGGVFGGISGWAVLGITGGVVGFLGGSG